MKNMSRKDFLGGALAASVIGLSPKVCADDAAGLVATKRWFKEAKFGLMAHWGLYSLAGGEWDGEVTDGLSEWMMYNFRIPLREYGRLARAFNPVLFKPLDWMKMAQDAGMKNDSWGYKPADLNFKSVNTILDLKRKNNSVGANYMLNVGPDGLGRIPPSAVRILRGIADAEVY